MPRSVLALCVAAAGAAGCANVMAGTVTVRREKLSLPWYRCVSSEEHDFKSGPFHAVKGTPRLVGKRLLEEVVLDNEYLRVSVLPEIGGAVGRVLHKPTGDDLFFWEGKVKDWTAHWESGVKVNFPALHHTVNTTDQPASWRVVRGEDGAATVAMWMEFSRFSEHYNEDYYGRHSNLLLSQHVTLSPGRGDFRVTYRIVNPAPYRQSRKFWNDALLPRSHTADGVVQGARKPSGKTTTEWIFPALYVSHHGGRQFHKYAESEMRIGEVRRPHTSVFAWDVPYGFAGLWYPEVKVNRLRLCDPNVTPGAKQYFRGEGSYRPNDIADSHMYNFVELFGGPDSVMEGVENWLAPGEVFEASYRYTMIRGIGKVDFANENVAVNVEFAAAGPGTLEAVPLAAVKSLVALLDGKALGAAQSCAPDKPARFPLPEGTRGGRIELVADGRKILSRPFPLGIPDDTSRHERIRKACDHNSAESLELFGDQFGYTHVIQRKMYPEGSCGWGRVLYRRGRIDEAVASLQKATETDADNGEAWHLLGAALLEQRKQTEAAAALAKAVAAGRPYPPARYFLALIALRRGSREQARKQLDGLLQTAPAHWEGRLLKAWIAGQDAATRKQAIQDLRAMDAEDPADPRVQTALAEIAEIAGDAKPAAAAREALLDLVKEPGAWRRVREFNAATHGIYYPPRRLQPPPARRP